MFLQITQKLIKLEFFYFQRNLIGLRKKTKFNNFFKCENDKFAINFLFFYNKKLAEKFTVWKLLDMRGTRENSWTRILLFDRPSSSIWYKPLITLAEQPFHSSHKSAEKKNKIVAYHLERTIWTYEGRHADDSETIKTKKDMMKIFAHINRKLDQVSEHNDKSF